MSAFGKRLALCSWGVLLFIAAGCTRSDGASGAGGDGGAAAVSSALDRPGTLPVPPATGLPSELIPPGLQLQR
jgi:hypothetical protein